MSIHTPAQRSLADRLVRAASRLGRWATIKTILHWALLITLIVLSGFVIVMMVAMSLRPTPLIYADFWGLPWPPIWTNYQTALLILIPPMLRTLTITFVSIAGILFFACLTAYALARTRFPGRDFVYTLIVGVMLIPGIILLTPNFILANQHGLRGSVWGLIVFYIAGNQPRHESDYETSLQREQMAWSPMARNYPAAARTPPTTN